MKTTLQTVEIRYPFSSKVFTAIEAKPIPPEELQKYVGVDTDVWVKNDEGIETVWKKDGYVGQNLPDGTKKSWWPKPTFKDAYELGKEFTGSSFQFHKNGDVTASLYGFNFIWFGSQVEAAAFEGEEHVWEDHFNDNGWNVGRRLVPISSTYEYDSYDDYDSDDCYGRYYNRSGYYD